MSINNILSFLYIWWLGIDRKMLFVILILMSLGVLLVASASPNIAMKINFSFFYFIKKQLIFFIPAILIILLISMFSIANIIKGSILVLILSLIMLIMVHFNGVTTKGATRWLYIYGTSIQPSEFVKPVFCVVNAWLLTISYKKSNRLIILLPVIIYIIFSSLILPQPDFGQFILLSMIFMLQIIIIGLPIIWLAFFFIILIVVAIIAYLTLAHVHHRIDMFLSGITKLYQIKKSLQAIANGGLLGNGLGEGTIKSLLPDAHTDFIFAVAVEELGAIFAIIISFAYFYILYRTIKFIFKFGDIFITISAISIAFYINIQAIINITTNLALIPPKGMTLPFISSGISSYISTAIAAGLLLGLTRHRQKY